MTFLYFLAEIRHPITDRLFSAVTLLGSEVGFIAIALFVFWCVNKREGYYLLTVGYFSQVLGQFLKIACRIPRPWVADPDFQPISSAVGDAGGYSFPSGHSQNAAGIYGSLALYNKNTPIRILCAAVMVLVPFSRMYLGVHTPLDVGVGVAISLAFAVLFYFPFRREPRRGDALGVFIAMFAFSGLFVLYMTLHSFPADIDAANLAEAQKNAWSFFGATAMLIPAYLFDESYVGFETEAVWWAQGLKYIIGAALTVGIKSALKAPLLALSGGQPWAHAVRYAIVILFVVCLWPLTFSQFAQLGRRGK